MRRKPLYFAIYSGIALLWAIFCAVLAGPWARAASMQLPSGYVLWVIVGIALLPGYLMCMMFLSNLFHAKTRVSTIPCKEPVAVLICARNEQDCIFQTIRNIVQQNYDGCIELLCVDNASSDGTRSEICRAIRLLSSPRRPIRLLLCNTPGKAHALNAGLANVQTRYFITVDADTALDKNAICRIMQRITSSGAACVAGNLLVKDAVTFTQKMQIYDYLISIAAVKRFQGSYASTLVAQGAFSAYETRAVRSVGGWRQCAGEDIVLTYMLLRQGRCSLYEPQAIGYTAVPKSIKTLGQQRARWARGMFDGLRAVAPWGQASFYSGYFESVNISIILLDLAYVFGFLAGIVMLLLGFNWLVGWMTLLTLPAFFICAASVYRFQRRLPGIAIRHSLSGFIGFVLVFQAIQSISSLRGYLQAALSRRLNWK